VNDTPAMMTIQDVAAELQVAIEVARRVAGQIPCVTLGPRSRRWRRVDFLTWLENRVKGSKQ
jgi:hypothetical protein